MLNFVAASFISFFLGKSYWIYVNWGLSSASFTSVCSYYLIFPFYFLWAWFTVFSLLLRLIKAFIFRFKPHCILDTRLKPHVFLCALSCLPLVSYTDLPFADILQHFPIFSANYPHVWVPIRDFVLFLYTWDFRVILLILVFN